MIVNWLPMIAGCGAALLAALLGSIEPTNAVLEILREAAAPLTTADCAVRLLKKLGINVGDPKTSRVATRLSNPR